MRGNTFGKLLSMTTFGESHGEAMGVIIDGLPSNLEFSKEKLISWLDRRKPGVSKGTTARVEEDYPEILSGIFENKTLGTPISVIVRNTGQRSSDYKELKDIMRPGHADQVTLDKYKIRDHRGGGRASGRETVSRVIAGYFASLVIPQVEVKASKIQIGKDTFVNSEDELVDKLVEYQKKNESIGAVLTIRIGNCPKALGEPAFDKLKADLAKAMLSIGGCYSFTLGEDSLAEKSGSDIINNIDLLGGIHGGISTGETIEFTVKFKPPVSVGRVAQKGRHDPCILPRAIPVVEAMTYFVLADHSLRQCAYEGGAV